MLSIGRSVSYELGVRSAIGRFDVVLVGKGRSCFPSRDCPVRDVGNNYLLFNDWWVGQCFRTYLPPHGVFLHGYQFRITKWICLHALQISRSVRSLSTTDSPCGVLAMDKPISSCMVVHFKNWIWNDMWIFGILERNFIPMTCVYSCLIHFSSFAYYSSSQVTFILSALCCYIP